MCIQHNMKNTFQKANSFTFSELVNIDQLREFLISFYNLTGMASAIIDLRGNILIGGKETGWQTICLDYHRVNEESCVNCNVSDTELYKSLKEGKQYVVYKCLNGMIDVVTPINIGGKHMANLFTGQFLSQEPDKDYFIAQAKKYGFDQEGYLNALSKVPVLSDKKVNEGMTVLVKLAEIIGEMGLKNKDLLVANEELEYRVAERTVELQAEIEDRKQAEDALKNSEERLRLSLESVQAGTWDWDIETGEVKWDNRMQEIFGIEPGTFKGSYEAWKGLVHPDDLNMAGKATMHSVETGEPYECEYRVKGNNGDWRYVRVQGIVKQDALGKSIRMTGVTIDITERKQTEVALVKNEEVLRLTLDSASDGAWNWDIVTGKVIFSDKWLKSLGYNREDVKPHVSFWESIVHPDDMPNTTNELNLHLAGKTNSYAHENRLLTKSGEYRWNIDRGRVIERDDSGKPLRMVGTDTDITGRKEAEKQIKESLREKEVLLKEIHHRVKNNMQVISSLLKLQSKNVKDKSLVSILDESQNRIKSMALVHEKLYQSEDIANINFGDYVKNLANNLFRSYKVSVARVALDMDIRDVTIGIDSVIPCGLILNELMANSLKYAFPDDRNGEIRISLNKNEESEVTLSFSDNGIGIPEDLDFKNTATLGLSLIHNLTEHQLGGNVELNRSNGTEFIISFKDEKYKERV